MQNFGRIKNAFNELISETLLLPNDEAKKSFKNYVKLVKENEVLKTQFLVINNLENKFETDREKAREYVKENIALFSRFDKEMLFKLNENLSTFVKVCGKEELLKEDFNYDLKSLHENISKLIFTERTPENIDKIVEATIDIVDYITKNKPKELVEEVGLPNSILANLMVDKFNERYSTLDESEKRILKSLIDANDDEKKIVYSDTLRECIDLIDAKLGTSDLDSKDKLLRVKDRLLNDKKEVNEDFVKNMSKLAELRDNLK